MTQQDLDFSKPAAKPAPTKRRRFKKPVVRFVQTYHDPCGNVTNYDVVVDGEVCGQLSKDSSWNGERYAVDGYCVEIDFCDDADELNAEESFEFRSTMSTAREALQLARAWARKKAAEFARRAFDAVDAADRA
jgi:hypothetical protein